MCVRQESEKWNFTTFCSLFGKKKNSVQSAHIHIFPNSLGRYYCALRWKFSWGALTVIQRLECAELFRSLTTGRQNAHRHFFKKRNWNISRVGWAECLLRSTWRGWIHDLFSELVSSSYSIKMFEEWWKHLQMFVYLLEEGFMLSYVWQRPSVTCFTASLIRYVVKGYTSGLNSRFKNNTGGPSAQSAACTQRTGITVYPSWRFRKK